MISAGAKAIPEGGYYSMPRVYGDGFLIAGDSAGYLNGARLKGIHLGIKADVRGRNGIPRAVERGRFVPAVKRVRSALRSVMGARRALPQRNFHQAFEYGQIAGMFNAGIGIVTKGRGFGLNNRLEGHAGHERMERIQRYFGDEHPHPPDKMRFDNKYTFNKVSDVYYGGVVHEENQPAHC